MYYFSLLYAKTLAGELDPDFCTNSFNIRIRYQLYSVCEFLSYGKYNPLTKYTIALASRGTVHYNGSLAIVLKLRFKKKEFIYIFFRCFYSHNFEVYTLDHVYTLRIDAVPRRFLLRINFLFILL